MTKKLRGHSSWREHARPTSGEISFELILLSGLVALGTVLGLQTLAADTGEGALTSACQLLQKVGLGAGDCGSGEGMKTERGDHDLGVSQHALTTPDQDIVTVRDGVHEAGSLELPQDVIAGLTAGLPTVESSFTGQAFRVASVAEEWFQGSGQQTGPRLVWNNPNDPRRTPPRRGPGIGRALGWAGLALAAMAIGKEWADDSMPPQLVVPIDDLNGVLLDWQLGGPVLLGIVSNGEASELRGLAMLRPGAMLEATSSDGTVFAEKPLAAEEWTLHLSALPEELAERIREAPGSVWDSDLYGDLPTPMVPLAPGEQLIEFNGIVYVRNLNAGTLRPLMTVGTDGPGALPDGAVTLAGGTGNGGDGSGGNRGDEPEEEDALPENVVRFPIASVRDETPEGAGEEAGLPKEDKSIHGPTASYDRDLWSFVRDPAGGPGHYLHRDSGLRVRTAFLDGLEAVPFAMAVGPRSLSADAGDVLTEVVAELDGIQQAWSRREQGGPVELLDAAIRARHARINDYLEAHGIATELRESEGAPYLHWVAIEDDPDPTGAQEAAHLLAEANRLGLSVDTELVGQHVRMILRATLTGDTTAMLASLAESLEGLNPISGIRFEEPSSHVLSPGDNYRPEISVLDGRILEFAAQHVALSEDPMAASLARGQTLDLLDQDREAAWRTDQLLMFLEAAEPVHQFSADGYEHTVYRRNPSIPPFPGIRGEVAIGMQELPTAAGPSLYQVQVSGAWSLSFTVRAQNGELPTDLTGRARQFFFERSIEAVRDRILPVYRTSLLRDYVIAQATPVPLPGFWDQASIPSSPEQIAAALARAVPVEDSEGRPSDVVFLQDETALLWDPETEAFTEIPDDTVFP